MRTASVILAVFICMIFIKAPTDTSLTNEQTLNAILGILCGSIILSAFIQDLVDLFK